MKNDVNVRSKRNIFVCVLWLLMKRAGSGAGSVNKWYGSEDPDPHPDPYKNVTDPEHYL